VRPAPLASRLSPQLYHTYSAAFAILYMNDPLSEFQN